MTDGGITAMTVARTPDERAMREGICGEIRHSDHFEWICVKPDHGAHDGRSQKLGADGNPTAWPKAAKHYFVRRFPNSDH